MLRINACVRVILALLSPYVSNRPTSCLHAQNTGYARVNDYTVCVYVLNCVKVMEGDRVRLGTFLIKSTALILCDLCYNGCDSAIGQLLCRMIATLDDEQKKFFVQSDLVCPYSYFGLALTSGTKVCGQMLLLSVALYCLSVVRMITALSTRFNPLDSPDTSNVTERMRLSTCPPINIPTQCDLLDRGYYYLGVWSLSKQLLPYQYQIWLVNGEYENLASELRVSDRWTEFVGNDHELLTKRFSPTAPTFRESSTSAAAAFPVELLIVYVVSALIMVALFRSLRSRLQRLVAVLFVPVMFRPLILYANGSPARDIYFENEIIHGILLLLTLWRFVVFQIVNMGVVLAFGGNVDHEMEDGDEIHEYLDDIRRSLMLSTVYELAIYVVVSCLDQPTATLSTLTISTVDLTMSSALCYVGVSYALLSAIGFVSSACITFIARSNVDYWHSGHWHKRRHFILALLATVVSGLMKRFEMTTVSTRWYAHVIVGVTAYFLPADIMSALTQQANWDSQTVSNNVTRREKFRSGFACCLLFITPICATWLLYRTFGDLSLTVWVMVPSFRTCGEVVRYVVQFPVSQWMISKFLAPQARLPAVVLEIAKVVSPLISPIVVGLLYAILLHYDRSPVLVGWMIVNCTVIVLESCFAVIKAVRALFQSHKLTWLLFSLPRPSPVDLAERNDVCSICFGQMTGPQSDPIAKVAARKTDNMADVRMTSCSHVFHRACLAAWFRVSVTCPVCRQKLD